MSSRSIAGAGLLLGALALLLFVYGLRPTSGEVGFVDSLSRFASGLVLAVVALGVGVASLRMAPRSSISWTCLVAAVLALLFNGLMVLRFLLL